MLHVVENMCLFKSSEYMGELRCGVIFLMVHTTIHFMTYPPIKAKPNTDVAYSHIYKVAFPFCPMSSSTQWTKLIIIRAMA